MSSIAKAIAAFFTTLGTWGATALADGKVSGPEWFGLCGVVVATAAVWQVTNTPVADGGGLPVKSVKKAARSSKGQVDAVTLLVIVLIVILIVVLAGGIPTR